MIYISFPMGSYHGWGVCGKNISREMRKIIDIKIITKDLAGGLKDDPISFYALKDSIADSKILSCLNSGEQVAVDGSVLHAVASIEFRPININLKGKKNIGYAFFEVDTIPEEYINNAKRYFDSVVVGSFWCEEVLRSYGLKNVKTVIQGIDSQIFNSSNNEKSVFEDRFVIFSGGKFEFRKGQDIVIKAFKILQDKYEDVLLVNCWFNMWEVIFSSMARSEHIIYPFPKGKKLKLAEKQGAILKHIIAVNGINPDKVIVLPPLPNPTMATIYKNTDLGLFPNRCEGGTNLVLMEYMACGKPVIASYCTGHRDILSEENSFLLKNMNTIKVDTGNKTAAEWFDPDIDELLFHLENAYLDWADNKSQKLAEKAEKAGTDMAKLTWKKTAQEFLDIISDSANG